MNHHWNNQTHLLELYGDVLDEKGNLKTKELIEKLYAFQGNEFSYTFKNDRLDGPIFIMYAKRKIVFSIRLDKSYKVPKCICVSGYTETSKTGSPLLPEAKSKYKYFQSINNCAIHALNTYVSYEKVPILALIEWWKNFVKFPDKVCKITENRLYWTQENWFLPTDFCSVELKEAELIHKSSIVFK